MGIPYVALCMVTNLVVVFSASVQITDRAIVKRDVAEMIPGIIIRGSSKTDAFGLHDENFEAGMGDAIVPREREKRSAVACDKKNDTLLTNGSSTRNARNPDTELLARRKRSAQSNSNTPTNGTLPSGLPPNGPPPDGSPPKGPPPNGSPPNGPPPNGPPPNGPPPNGPPPNGPPPNGPTPNGPTPTSNAEGVTESQERRKRSVLPCGNATNSDSEVLARRKRSAQSNSYPSNNRDRHQPDMDNEHWNTVPQRQKMDNDGRNSSANTRNDRVKRSPKPCNGQNGNNGRPTGVSNNNFPQLQQQQQQQQPMNTGGANIADLQRDQSQRIRRAVDDPDRVLPTNSADDKNLFERIVQVAKEVVARVTRWVGDMDKEQAVSNLKNTPEKPKL